MIPAMIIRACHKVFTGIKFYTIFSVSRSKLTSVKKCTYVISIICLVLIHGTADKY
jgi:hypothetical protein